MEENNNTLFEGPVQIYVSYAWGKDGDDLIPPRQDKKWRNLQSLIKNVVDEVKKRVEKRPGEFALDVRINRLRGRHGSHLLGTLRERINRGDVLVMDIADTEVAGVGFNPNVMLELGMAIGIGKLEARGLFVLKPKTLKWPSDLSGFLYSEYDPEKTNVDNYRLADTQGFRAALRSAIEEIARARGMIGNAKDISIEIEGEEADKVN